MDFQEVFETISNIDGKSANVWITTKESGKRYKMNLHIPSSNILKMKTIGTRGIGYNVTEFITSKWESIEICKTRRKKE